MDGAQLVPHAPVDVTALGVDLLAFSAHKMLGPTGIGVLWGRRDLLETIEPIIGGGEMIRDVTLEGATWNDLPWRFEAGTPPIAEAIGLGAAVDYLEAIGMERVAAHEHALAEHALAVLAGVGGLRLFGPRDAADRGAAFSFELAGVHPHDIASVLDHEGIAVRAGHHCTKPLHRVLGVPSTARASFYVYNTPDEIDRLGVALDRARELFA
jgi:cysteine desulfurase/selenocysteine lyase